MSYGVGKDATVPTASRGVRLAAMRPERALGSRGRIVQASKPKLLKEEP